MAAAEKICPQRIISTAIVFLEEMDLPKDCDDAERLDNTILELYDLNDRLNKAGIINL